MMAGVPLTGKTTLARALTDELPATLHVENDRLRRLVVDAMDRSEPAFDGEENHATYAAARQLVERGLEQGLHVLHDATNLRETDRKRSYALADELEAPVRVVFLTAPKTILEQRAREEGPAAEQALAALGDRQPRPSAHTRTHAVLDGTDDVDANVGELLARDGFRVLAKTPEPSP